MSIKQYVGIATFSCNQESERQAIFNAIDKLLDTLPNTIHVFTEHEGTMTEKAK